MGLFEEYREIAGRRDHREPPAHTRIRPAVPTDAAALGAMEAAREGGDAADIAARLEEAMATWGATGAGLLLVAEHADRLLGLAKVRHFTPPPGSPERVAPSGWYLMGVIVPPEWRRRGIARRLTRARLDWIAGRDDKAYYFANAGNRVSIELHRPFGFVELTRDFTFPRVTFRGGEGILFRADLDRPARAGGETPLEHPVP